MMLQPSCALSSPSPCALHLHGERAEISLAKAKLIEGEGRPLAPEPLAAPHPRLDQACARSAYTLSPQAGGERGSEARVGLLSQSVNLPGSFASSPLSCGVHRSDQTLPSRHGRAGGHPRQRAADSVPAEENHLSVWRNFSFNTIGMMRVVDSRLRGHDEKIVIWPGKCPAKSPRSPTPETEMCESRSPQWGGRERTEASEAEVRCNVEASSSICGKV
jgi:hypothetical protein